MRKEANAGGVTYIGPRGFAVAFCVVCGLFLATFFGLERVMALFEPGPAELATATTAVAAPVRDGLKARGTPSPAEGPVTGIAPRSAADNDNARRTTAALPSPPAVERRPLVLPTAAPVAPHAPVPAIIAPTTARPQAISRASPAPAAISRKPPVPAVIARTAPPAVIAPKRPLPAAIARQVPFRPIPALAPVALAGKPAVPRIVVPRIVVQGGLAHWVGPYVKQALPLSAQARRDGARADSILIVTSSAGRRPPSALLVPPTAAAAAHRGTDSLPAAGGSLLIALPASNAAAPAPPPQPAH